jgi:hypothetical protein
MVIYGTATRKVGLLTPTNENFGRTDVLGKGYFDNAEKVKNSDLYCPRSHTPGGVIQEGEGLGTILYCGLALTAAYASIYHQRQGNYLAGVFGNEGPVGPCIHSERGSRSSSADKWWKSQEKPHPRFPEYPPLVENHPVCEEEEDRLEADYSALVPLGSTNKLVKKYQEDQIREEAEGWDNCEDCGKLPPDFTPDCAGCEDWESIFNKHKDVDVTGIKIPLTMYYEVCDPNGMQVLPAANVFRRGLVLHVNPYLDDLFAEHESSFAPLQALIQLNLKDVTDVDFTAFIIQLLRDKGASEADMADFKKISKSPLLKNKRSAKKVFDLADKGSDPYTKPKMVA